MSDSTAHVIGVQEHEMKTKCDWKRRTTEAVALLTSNKVTQCDWKSPTTEDSGFNRKV